MSTETQEIREQTPALHDLSEEDAAASASCVRPQRLSPDQVDGEVGRERSSASAGEQPAGSEDPGRNARTHGRQLRLGPVRQGGSVPSARVTGKEVRLIMRKRAGLQDITVETQLQNADYHCRVKSDSAF